MKKASRSHIKDSYIVRFFVFLTQFVYQTVAVGFFGRIFTAYDGANKRFCNSGIGRFARPSERSTGRFHRTVRRRLALAMSESRIMRGLSGLVYGLCRCSLRTLGLFFVTAGAYSAVMYWLFAVIWHSPVVDVLNLFSGIAAALVGILLLFSDDSLGYALSRGIFGEKIFVGMLGVADDTLKDMEKKGRQGYVVAVPLGMALGAVSAWISPFYLLVAGIAVLYFLLVLSVPEAGVMVLILLLPFAGFLPHSAMWILLAAAVPLFSYFLKLLRGNRAFHMELQDLPVLLMVMLFLFSGFSVAGKGAWQSALLSALLTGFYFLVVNVISTPQWMDRCRISVIVAATAASLLGIVQFLAAVIGTGGSLPISGGAVRAGFMDQTTFAYFLAVAFPFTLFAFASVKKKYRLPTGFAMVAVIAATVLTWVQSAMIAIVIMILVFLLIHERRSFPFIFTGGVLAPLAAWLLPDRAKSGMTDLIREDSANAIARSMGAGSMAAQMFFEKGSGIFSRGAGFSRLIFGLGAGGIEQFCMLYTALSPEVVSRSLNFWLYRLLEGGLPGVILPAALFFLVYQNCFSVLRTATVKEHRFSAIGGIVMTTGVLVVSIFRYAWYDPAALAFYFIAVALIAADARMARFQRTEAKEAVQDGTAAELEI